MPQASGPRTEGSPTFDPDKFFQAWESGEVTPPYDNNLRRFIIRAFGLSLNDDYQYQATAAVTLLQAQTYIEFGAQGGLHAWYRDDEGNERYPPPSATDIAAYTAIFRPNTQTTNALKALAANAKKGSIRSEIAEHLQALYEPPRADSGLTLAKSKAHVNPYLDILAWANQTLSWGGPESRTVRVTHSHAILPILYHHFGCVCPSYDALSLVLQLVRGRRVVDLGSGNGYWTFMLRNLHERQQAGRKNPQRLEVVPVDSGMSEWRTMWIGDTVTMDGWKWLRQQNGARDAVLLLVYPNTGDDFTGKMIRAYEGTTIISAGTQNASGFTGFADETIAQWVARELPQFEKIFQIPLPSFAGKDEALFAFEKKSSAGHEIVKSQ